MVQADKLLAPGVVQEPEGVVLLRAGYLLFAVTRKIHLTPPAQPTFRQLVLVPLSIILLTSHE